MHNLQKVLAVMLAVSIILLIVSALTPSGAQTNILPNSGFEDDLTGWSVVPGTATYAIDTATKHSGSSSVMGIEKVGEDIGRLYQDVTGVAVPNQQYQISGWIKTQDVTGSVVIALDYVASYATPADGYIGEIGYVTGTTDWTYYESPVFTLPIKPADADSLYFLFDFNAGTGKAWFDNVALTDLSGTPTPTPAPSSTGDSWVFFGHDLSGARYSSSTAPKTSQILWQIQLDSAVRSAVTIYGGAAYTGTMVGTIYCLDASNGRTIWSYPTGGTDHKIFSTPVVVNGRVFVGSTNWDFYALNAETGALDWSFHTGGGMFASAAVTNNIVYFGSTDKNFYALNADTGAIVWTYPTGGEIRDTAAIVDGVVYFTSFDDYCYALNAQNGNLIWRSLTNDDDTYENSSPAVVDGVLYVGSTDTNVYALRASDGQQLWAFSTPAKVSSSPAIHNGIVYVGSESGDFYAINAQTGTQVWTYKTGSGAIYSSPGIADGAVYVCSYSGDEIFAFDASTGNLLWDYNAAGNVFSSPVLSGGVMFVGDYARYVYAFGTEFTPGSTSNETPSSLNPTSYVPGQVWAPLPSSGAAASVVTVGTVATVAIVAAAVSTVPAATGASSSFFDKIAEKLRDLLPDTVKEWAESLISSKRKLHVEEKPGSPFMPTKGELLVYLISTLILTFSFAYVKVASLTQFLTVLPVFIFTSLLVGLIRTYIITVYARKHGVWTEYKLWYLGLAMYLVSTIAFHAPFSTATRKVSVPSEKNDERFAFRLSCLTIGITLGFGGIFLALLLTGNTLIGGAGLAMCLITAFFETFPIKPMAGTELFKYNKKVWIGLFLVTLALYVVWLMHVL
jgi:outer membrane protein assembly factor BamB